MLGGLGLTASGTQAAERVRSKSRRRSASIWRSIELPALPLDPGRRRRSGRRDPPGTERHGRSRPSARPQTEGDGKPDKRVRIVIRDKDGKVTTASTDDRDFTMSDNGRTRSFTFRDKDGKLVTRTVPMPPMPPDGADAARGACARLKDMPEIRSGNCAAGDGGDGAPVETRDGRKRRIVICTNRIERMAARRRGRRRTRRARRGHDVHPPRCDGIGTRWAARRARAASNANRDLSDTQRSAALEGIDEAIAEMAAKPND